MTVKLIQEDDKERIAQLYAAKLCDTESLAVAYGVSKRTINRVMVEQGVNHVRFHKPKAKSPDLPITMFEPSDEINIDESPAPQPVDQPKLSIFQKILRFFGLGNSNQPTNAQPRN